MLTPAREFGEARFQDDQVVVALPHLRLVLAELAAELGGGDPAAEVERSEDLGLARVTLHRAPLEAWATGRATAQQADDGAWLSQLLEQLYTEFRARYGGWTPTMGKNRAVDEVGGNHTIGVGDEGPPTAVTDRQLAPREGDPGTEVRVAVGDTRLHPHLWLEGSYHAPPAALWTGGSAAVPYQTGHAGFVVGTILQAAPGAHVEVRRLLDDDGLADSWDVAKALVRFERLGVHVLNLSLGCFTGDDKPPLVLQAALERLDPDLVVIAAAGNHAAQMRDRRRPLWPAALPRVVAVGAIDGAGGVPPWSPEPSGWPWVDVLATGEDVVSTYVTGPVELPDGPEDFHGLASWSGTSFAAARLTGEVAAATVPGRIDAATALRGLLECHRGDDGVPRIT
ncbi:hypothetical protein GCM10023328_40640 [Modestobacter marinus]|uniref:Peptidase S8/S53 domain-containing protein n=1 Tax=Modestobacter marinus TaxID=477641 RepID=A0A846LKQ7_9ACTN|nr:S8/S53 family peptidase [Modestobacter marinus]NIH68633.1 hypothetical protein [Modestobacter marinus]GGL58836.1 hypothetical protein GCM10011589_13550 [Modestobacter marinus]